MKLKLVFASLNKHKLEEVQALLGKHAIVAGLSEQDFPRKLSETKDSLEGNALQKARFVFDKLGESCFADDTGLEIKALGGEPGVYSARYAKGDPQDQTAANIDLVLKKMRGIIDRSAQFRTVVALVDGPRKIFFEGIVRGEILTERQGDQGFGYDPIFKPQGYDQSFAEMTMAEKNKISHRGAAFRKLREYFTTVKFKT